MRRLIGIAALAFAAATAALPAGAQDQSGGGQGYADQGGGAAAIPPSAAVKRAMRAVPGAKPLGVKLENGMYVVRLKQDGSITQVGVDPATGEVFPIE